MLRRVMRCQDAAGLQTFLKVSMCVMFLWSHFFVSDCWFEGDLDDTHMHKRGLETK